MTRLAKFSMKHRFRPVVAGLAVVVSLAGVTAPLAPTPVSAAPVFTSDINVRSLTPGTVMAPIGPKNNKVPVAGMVAKTPKPVPRIGEVLPIPVVTDAVLLTFPVSVTQVRVPPVDDDENFTLWNRDWVGILDTTPWNGQRAVVLDTTWLPNGIVTIEAKDCALGQCGLVAQVQLDVQNPTSAHLQATGSTSGVRGANGANWENDDVFQAVTSPSGIPGAPGPYYYSLANPNGNFRFISSVASPSSAGVTGTSPAKEWKVEIGWRYRPQFWVEGGGSATTVGTIPLTLKATNGRTRYSVRMFELIESGGKAYFGAKISLSKGIMPGLKLSGRYLVKIDPLQQYLPQISLNSRINTGYTGADWWTFPPPSDLKTTMSTGSPSYVLDTALLPEGSNTLYLTYDRPYVEPFPFFVQNGSAQRILLLGSTTSPPQPIESAVVWSADDTIELSKYPGSPEIASSGLNSLGFESPVGPKWASISGSLSCDRAVAGPTVVFSLDERCSDPMLPSPVPRRIDVVGTGLMVSVQEHSVTLDDGGVPVTYPSPTFYLFAKNPTRSCLRLGC